MALYSKHFYHQIIRKYVIAFGTLFSNINVVRKNASGTEISRETVPLTFASKEKFYQRLVQDYAEESRIAIKLPHIAFEISDYQYDSSRKLNSKRSIGKKDTEGNYNFFYNPVPYNIGFNLFVFTKTQEEGLQIVEQILPFFTPDYTLTLKLTELDDFKTDIPISLTNVSIDDTFEGELETRRTIVWTLSFVLKGFLLGPFRNKSVILSSRINNIVVKDTPVIVTPEENNTLPTQYEYFEFEGIGGEIISSKELNTGDENNLIVPKVSGITFFVEVRDEANNLFDFEDYNIFANFRKSLSTSPISINVITTEPGILKVEVTKEHLENVELGLYKFYITIENKINSDLLSVKDGFLNIVN